jgi:hypothetical protein
LELNISNNIIALKTKLENEESQRQVIVNFEGERVRSKHARTAALICNCLVMVKMKHLDLDRRMSGTTMTELKL